MALPTQESNDEAEGHGSQESDEGGSESRPDTESSRDVDGTSGEDSGSVVEHGVTVRVRRDSGSGGEEATEGDSGSVDEQESETEAEAESQEKGIIGDVLGLVKDVVEDVVEAVVKDAVSSVIPEDLVKSRGRTRRHP